MGVARLGASPAAGSSWLGKWQVTNRLSGDQQARQAGMGNLRGGLSQEGMSVVFVILLAAWAGRPGSPFSASQAGGPLGKAYYWSGSHGGGLQGPCSQGGSV